MLFSLNRGGSFKFGKPLNGAGPSRLHHVGKAVLIAVLAVTLSEKSNQKKHNDEREYAAYTLPELNRVFLHQGSPILEA